MTWFKVDDSFHAHPKVLATDADAIGLWVVAGAWSSAHLTEGFVPDHALPRLLPGSVALARKLVTAGLWRRVRGGHQFHDWTEYQPTKEEATAARDGMSSGGALGNHRRWHVDKGRKNASCRYCQGKQPSPPESGSDHLPDAPPESGANPPSRPDPSLKNNIKTSSSTAAPLTDSPQFVRFWAAYPRRQGKGQARKAWAKAIKTADPEVIIERAGRFAALRGNEDPKFTPHPSTWLNGERWDDVPDPEPREPGPVMPWDVF
jgi:hypothetical protein